MMETITSYDLCLAWDWEHDTDFAELLDVACRSHGLSMLQVTPDNLADVLRSLDSGQIAFRAFLDRASEADAHFIPLVQWARDHAIYRINPHEQASRTWNKVTMHLALSSAGLHLPYTIIVPAYNEQPEPPSIDLKPLGGRFTVKPAHGGGGQGVLTEATSLSQVLIARQEYPMDRYLLQAHIVPAQLDSRPAWFRVIYCVGQVYPCWWDTGTHVFAPVSLAEESQYRLAALRATTVCIASVCGLHLFSTEIALTPDGCFVVVDYVNDPIDLRLQSKALDGVPDDIVRDIAGSLAKLVGAQRPSSYNVDPQH